MTKERTPNWQPLTALPLVAQAIDGMLASTQENHLTLQAARHRPYSLDDYTVARTQKVYREQAEYLPLYEEQLTRWQQETLTAEQRHEIARLTNQLQRLRTENDAILQLAAILATQTIEQLLSKPDAEIGLDFLRRHP
jgi:transposase-like protein